MTSFPACAWWPTWSRRSPPRATRLAQGTLTAQGEIVDPLDADRDGAAIGGALTGTVERSR